MAIVKCNHENTNNLFRLNSKTQIHQSSRSELTLLSTLEETVSENLKAISNRRPLFLANWKVEYRNIVRHNHAKRNTITSTRLQKLITHYLLFRIRHWIVLYVYPKSTKSDTIQQSIANLEIFSHDMLLSVWHGDTGSVVPIITSDVNDVYVWGREHATAY